MKTTPRRSLQYLLSVDRGLRKISLRRLRTAASSRPRRSRSRRATTRKHAAANSSSETGRALMLAGIGLIAIAAFAASRGITQRVDPETPIVAAAAAAPMPPETIAMAGTSSASAPVVDARRHDDVGTAGHVARQAIVPSKTAAPTSAAIRSVDKPAAATPDKTTAGSPETAGDARDRSSVDASPTVTIAGCVERDRKAFWLKSVSGDDVPRTRSWRSGFFKKRASSVSLMDATDGVGLEGYVGQRVAATGRLVNGELRAVALQQLAGSCGGN